jgi:hypothetical protein
MEPVTSQMHLTFNDEAKAILNQSAAEFIKNKNRLLQLARRSTTNDKNE